MQIGTRVMVMRDPKITGTVQGHATEYFDNYERAMDTLLVRLDKGFYNPQQTMFISIIVAHINSLTEIDDDSAPIQPQYPGEAASQAWRDVTTTMDTND